MYCMCLAFFSAKAWVLRPREACATHHLRGANGRPMKTSYTGKCSFPDLDGLHHDTMMSCTMTVSLVAGSGDAAAEVAG